MFFSFRTSLRNLRKHNKNILYCRSIYLMSFSLYYVQHFKSLFPFTHSFLRGSWCSYTDMRFYSPVYTLWRHKEMLFNLKKLLEEKDSFSSQDLCASQFRYENYHVLFLSYITHFRKVSGNLCESEISCNRMPKDMHLHMYGIFQIKCFYYNKLCNYMFNPTEKFLSLTFFSKVLQFLQEFLAFFFQSFAVSPGIPREIFPQTIFLDIMAFVFGLAYFSSTLNENNE